MQVHTLAPVTMPLLMRREPRALHRFPFGARRTITQDPEHALTEGGLPGALGRVSRKEVQDLRVAGRVAWGRWRGQRSAVSTDACLRRDVCLLIPPRSHPAHAHVHTHARAHAHKQSPTHTHPPKFASMSAHPEYDNQGAHTRGWAAQVAGRAQRAVRQAGMPPDRWRGQP